MSWIDTLQEAKYGGITFEYVNVEDVVESALARHAYPYVRGADIEDMGREPRKIPMEAVFYGSDYENKLKAFIKKLDEAGAKELVHPIFGSIQKVIVARYDIRHEADNVDQANVKIEFEESVSAVTFFGQADTSPGQINQATDAARGFSIGTLGDLLKTLQQYNPLASLSAFKAILLGPINQLRSLTGSVISIARGVIYAPIAWSRDLTSLVGTVSGLSGSLTPGGVFADYQQAQQRIKTALGFTVNTSTAPVWTASRTTPATASATGAVATASDFYAWTAYPVPVRQVADTPIINWVKPTEPNLIYAAVAHMHVVMAMQAADDAATIFANEQTFPSLQPIEVEQIANDARSKIEASILEHRALYALEVALPTINALKDVALAVQTAAQALIELKPPLIQKTVEAPGNLRLIAHHFYGDHARAPELWRLNIRADSNFIAAKEQLNAFES